MLNFALVHNYNSYTLHGGGGGGGKVVQLLTIVMTFYGMPT